MPIDFNKHLNINTITLYKMSKLTKRDVMALQPGPMADAWVAKIIMECDITALPAGFNPSTNMAHSMEAVDRVRLRHGPGGFSLIDDVDNVGQPAWVCSIGDFDAEDVSAPMAVTRALLLNAVDAGE